MATKTTTTKNNNSTKNRWDGGGFKARELKPGERLTRPQSTKKRK